MPSIELFERQTQSYKNKVLQKNAILRVAIEASNDNIWYKYVGDNGLFIGVENYQSSGEGEDVYRKAGLNEKEIVRTINRKMSEKGNK